MFLPRFSYTPAITELLGEIESLRSRIEQAPGDEEAAAALSARCAARRASGACLLDGIPVTPEQAGRVLSGARVDIPEEIALAVKSYQFALDRVGTIADGDKPLRVAAFMTLHFYLLYDPRARKQVPGLRRERAGLADIRDGTPLAFAPSPAELQPLLHDLAGWLHSSRNAVSPILRAAVAHLRLVHLQPFSSANARAASILADMLLLDGGFALQALPPVEAHHAANLDLYYSALLESSDNAAWTGDVTAWLEYYCAALAEELRPLVTPPGRLPRALDKDAPLNARQRQILELLAEPGATLTNQECQRLFDVSPVTAARDFRDLVELGKVVLRGQGRGSYYVMRNAIMSRE